MFLPSTLASLPPGVMLLSCSTVPRDSATDIEKTSPEGVPERERSNRSVVKMCILVPVLMHHIYRFFFGFPFLHPHDIKNCFFEDFMALLPLNHLIQDFTDYVLCFTGHFVSD